MLVSVLEGPTPIPWYVPSKSSSRGRLSHDPVDELVGLSMLLKNVDEYHSKASWQMNLKQWRWADANEDKNPCPIWSLCIVFSIIFFKSMNCCLWRNDPGRNWDALFLSPPHFFFGRSSIPLFFCSSYDNSVFFFKCSAPFDCFLFVKSTLCILLLVFLTSS